MEVVEYCNFCNICNTLLTIPEGGPIICHCCGNKVEFERLQVLETSTTNGIKQPHEWLTKLISVMDKENSSMETKEEDKRAVVDEDCPKCGYTKASFYTMQMRSADEGQTVFYTCLKCSHKWSQNN